MNMIINKTKLLLFYVFFLYFLYFHLQWTMYIISAVLTNLKFFFFNTSIIRYTKNIFGNNFLIIIFVQLHMQSV